MMNEHTKCVQQIKEYAGSHPTEWEALVGPGRSVDAYLDEYGYIKDIVEYLCSDLEIEIICDRHGGLWGTDETCERCVGEDGWPRLLSNPGPLGPDTHSDDSQTWLVFHPILGDLHSQWIGPFKDESAALKAQDERWPWLAVTTQIPDDPTHVISYENAAKEQDARSL